MKRTLENSYDFSFQKAFKAIDDWCYNYIDQSNLKRFLRGMGYVATKQELIAILRRFDMDGDAKISFQEFEYGMRSSLGNSNGKLTLKQLSFKNKRANSATGLKKKRSLSRDVTPDTQWKAYGQMTKSMGKAVGRNSNSEVKLTKARKKSASAVANRRRAMDQLQMSYGGAGVHPSTGMGGQSMSYACESPTLNKSVSFSQQVRVREFPSTSHKHQHSPLRNVRAERDDIAARKLSYGQDSMMMQPPNQRQSISPLKDNDYGMNQYRANGGSPLVRKVPSNLDLREPSPTHCNRPFLATNQSPLRSHRVESHSPERREQEYSPARRLPALDNFA